MLSKLYNELITRINSFILLIIAMLSAVLPACSVKEDNRNHTANEEKALSRIIYVQQLYNLTPAEDIIPEIKSTIDSMRRDGRNPYYFAALNVLIDRLFSEGHFSEADSLAVRMHEEAAEDTDSLSIAMAKRVRAQMFYKLSQPQRALNELEPAKEYITNPYRSSADFGTATNILEWLWIISHELGDTVRMNNAGTEYAHLVEKNSTINNWIDPTGHYPATAFAFKGAEAFSKGQTEEAKALLDSAGSYVIPSLPSRAYEHLYEVGCVVKASEGNRKGAIADVDTLLATHKDFPWFYLKDLLLKARILNMIGEHENSASAYSEYVAFHDSLSNNITDKRLHDLTVLYRTEIDREQKRAERFRLFALGSVALLLLILLILALLLAAKEKKRNRLLVERLKEFDLATENIHQPNYNDNEVTLSPIEKLDSHMLHDRPYTNPALSRKELAEFIGITQDALGQLIRNEKGVSVRTYINSFRLEEARHVLGSNSNEGIADLAVRLGFGTSRTLQRAFKDRYDMSPTQYREASKEIENTDT
ncbi:MAG: helix-turn-helix domain-containing protein [Bacteroides sp.]|nr:helix-turn-helix domain-containing protein [Bacteroides sp.]